MKDYGGFSAIQQTEEGDFSRRQEIYRNILFTKVHLIVNLAVRESIGLRNFINKCKGIIHHDNYPTAAPKRFYVGTVLPMGD